MTAHEPAPEAQAAEPPPPSSGRQVVRLLGAIIVAAVLLGMVAWAAGALKYSNLPATLRPIAAGGMLLGGAWATLRRKQRWATRGVLLAVWVGVALYWMTIKPSNERNGLPMSQCCQP